MDKSKIKEVKYSHEKQSLMIEFNDGSLHGEIGKVALKTMKQLNDNDVPYIDIDRKSNKKQNVKN